MSKGEVISSPTVLFEALFTTLIIYAYEKIDVATFDMHGSYLHIKIPEGNKIILKLRGCFVNILCDTNTEHTTNVIYERVQKDLHLRVLRAIYG